jgi:hypothetical protein
MRMSLPGEASISNELLPGEEVLWSGSPDPKSKSTVSSSRLIISGWIYTMLGLLLMMFSFILSVVVLRDYIFPLITLIIVGTFIFIVGLLCLRVGYSSTRFSSQKVFYAITNRRVIIVSGGRYLRVTSYSKQAITQVQRVERPNGFGDLIIAAGPYGNVMVNRQNTLMAIPSVRHVEQTLLTMLNQE